MGLGVMITGQKREPFAGLYPRQGDFGFWAGEPFALCHAMTDGKVCADEQNQERSFAEAQDDEIKREIASFLAMTKTIMKDPLLTLRMTK